MPKLDAKPLLYRMSFRIQERVFHTRIHVFLGYEIEDFHKILIKRGYEGSFYGSNTGSRTLGLTSTITHRRSPYRDVAICIPRFQNSVEDHNTLVHEIVHAVVQIFEDYSVDLNGMTQEFAAEMAGWMYQSIEERIGKNLKKSSRKPSRRGKKGH